MNTSIVVMLCICALIFIIHIECIIIVIEKKTISLQYSIVELQSLIEKCREEQDMNKKIEILYQINSLIPKQFQITLPSYLTNDYIDSRVLHKIEERILIKRTLTDQRS
jgi:hypothetical protein